MSQENVERLREAYELVNNEFEALKRGELDALLVFFDPDVVIEYVDAPDPERYEGHEGVRKWFHDSFGVWESVFMEAEEFIEVGDWTVVQLRGRVRGEKSGAELEVRLTATHRFRDGKIVHDRVYLDRDRALEAAGLSEYAISQENVEIVRRAFEAFNRGGVDACVSEGLWSPEIIWDVTPSGIPGLGTYHGQEAVRMFFEDDWFNAFPFEEWEVELEEVIDAAGDRVISMSRQHGRGASSGAVAELELAQIGMVRDGRIVRVDNYLDREKALEAAGLSEYAISQKDVEIVHRLVEAWNRGDLELILSLFDPDCEVIFPPDVPEPGPFHGYADLREWAKGFLAAWESHRAEVVELVETETAVVAMLHLVGRGSGSGIEMDETDAHVFSFRDRKITRWQNFNERSEALEAAGLSE